MHSVSDFHFFCGAPTRTCRDLVLVSTVAHCPVRDCRAIHFVVVYLTPVEVGVGVRVFVTEVLESPFSAGSGWIEKRVGGLIA